MKFKLFGFFIIFSIMLFTGCEKKEIKEEIKKEKVSKQSTTTQSKKVLRLKTNNQKILEVTKIGNQMIFKGYENKIVLLNFFATWCAPCKREIPHLNILRKKYNKDFEIIAVLLEQSKSQKDLDEFISYYQITYPVTNRYDNIRLAQSIGGIKTIPTMFMYAKDGSLIQKFTGVIPQEMLEDYIKNALRL